MNVCFDGLVGAESFRHSFYLVLTSRIMVQHIAAANDEGLRREALNPRQDRDDYA
jgi:hypothetical protein